MRPDQHGPRHQLTITYRVVHRHGGRIEVESELGVGSTFRVLLPVAGPSGPSVG